MSYNRTTELREKLAERGVSATGKKEMETMSDETTLLPCAVCGGKAETREIGFPYHYWDVWCDGECFEHFCEKATEAEAIEAWNNRHMDTCKMVTSGTACKSNTYKRCTACGAYGIGEHYDGNEHIATPKFCPECGGKVV